MQKGYIALLTVLIVMAVVVVSATTVALLSIGEGQSGFALFKGEDTLAFVEGCVEDVMLKVRADSSYNGTSIDRPEEGTCTITYNLGGSGPTNWDITVSTSLTTYKRSIRVVFTRNPTGITLTSWKEV